jgi:hypothetical protein
MKNISRRKFITDSTKGAAGAFAVTGLAFSCSLKGNHEFIPRRKLGKTSLDVSIISFGGGSQFMKNKEKEWQKLMEEALSYGVNLFDTAPRYSRYKGENQVLGSDERFGVILQKCRGGQAYWIFEHG